ncbi:DUF2812 domain-containing protein, partial [Anaerotignum faecicola]
MKYKRKLTPATTFDFAAMETWLSDMAEDGWIPVDFRGSKVKFRQDEPQKRIFRIAIPDFYNDTPSAKQIEAYRQLGWEYLCGYRCKGYLLANLTEHPDEPYIDPEVQKKNIDALYREERYLYLVGVILFTLLFIGMGLLGWRDLGQHIIDHAWFSDLLMPILFFCLAVYYFYELRLLKKLKTELEQGNPVEHEKDYTRKLELSKISNLISTAANVLVILVLVFEIFSISTKGEPTERPSASVSPLPYVPLENVSGDSSGIETRVHAEPTFFAPLLLQTTARGDASWMTTTLLEVRPSFLTEQAFLTLGANGTFPDTFLPSTAERALVLSSDSFDEGYFYQETCEMRRQMLT